MICRTLSLTIEHRSSEGALSSRSFIPSATLIEPPTDAHSFEKRTGPSVTLAAAFTSGAGNKNNAATADGTHKAASDKYTCYSPTSWKNFPAKDKWLDWQTMWDYNKANMYNACSNLGLSPDDNQTQVHQINLAIQQVAQESLVDHRFILAVVVQESLGCVYVGTTTSPGAGSHPNPGLMQSHNGTTYDVKNSAASIVQMIRDGTQGTAYGVGLVQKINYYGNIYEAARAYNSGSVNKKNLTEAYGATSTYVNDIANRMTGWLYADRVKC